MPEVTMPRLSDSMEEGTILRWLVSDGDSVSRGDEIVEIETDKATMTYEADSDGVLSIVADEGSTLPVGEVIASIGEGASSNGGGDGAASSEQAQPEAEEEGDDEQPESGEEESDEEPAPSDAPSDEGPSDARSDGAPSAPAPPSSGDGGERVKASPIARRIAQERGLDLHDVSGTGPGGRIVKADVEGAAEAAPAAEKGRAEDQQPAEAPGRGKAKGDVDVQELSRTQQTIARRMAESRATVPDFTLSADVDMERAMEGRAALKETAGEGGLVPSVNDLIVKACAIALREFPRANGSYRDGRFELHERVNVGVAVAARDALIVPTIFDADRKGLAEIAAEARTLATKARNGNITPPEVSGGTFTVSNLGMYGIREFVAVINPPQAAILSVGAVEPRPVVRDGEVVARHQMSVTLACDHRILYGAEAAEFLARIRSLLEAPLALAL